MCNVWYEEDEAFIFEMVKPNPKNLPGLSKKNINEVSHLFKLENVLVEVVLETFIGKVDAELFEAVVLVILKTENVQHSNGQDLTDTA